MRNVAIAVVVMAMLAPAAHAQNRPDQKAFFDLYKEMVETNTVVNVGSCTQAAAQVDARLKAAGFADADITRFSVPEHPNDGGIVAILKGRDAAAKPILLLGHLDVVAAKREDWQRDPFKLVKEDGYYYARGASCGCCCRAMPGARRCCSILPLCGFAATIAATTKGNVDA